MELQVKKLGGMDEFEILEPVSPTGQYFSRKSPSVCVVSVFEFENPIDDSTYATLLHDPIVLANPRFSSIMVEDGNGRKHWKLVKVNVKDHIKVPRFPDGLSIESYTDYFDDYISRLGVEPLPTTKPLWEIHIFKYPTKNASGCILCKFDHSLGDGYSLMGMVFSVLKRADNPSIPLTFPSIRKSVKSENGLKNLIRVVPKVVSCAVNTAFDFGLSIMRSTFLEDSKTPIRSGEDGVEYRQNEVIAMTFSLDQVKQIKEKLNVTINDVISGVIFLGTRLYMEAASKESGNARSTSMVLFNTRSIGGYKSLDDMFHNSKSKSLWGNQFSFLDVPIPKLPLSDHSFDPLNFVFEVHHTIKRRRNSLAIYLIAMLIQSIRNFRGPEVAANYLHRSEKNASMGLTNLVGPIEKVSVCNQPVKGLYFMVFNVPQNYRVTVLSYMNQLRVALGTEKGFIDRLKLRRCIEEAYDMIYKAALCFDSHDNSSNNHYA